MAGTAAVAVRLRSAGFVDRLTRGLLCIRLYYATSADACWCRV